MSKSKNVIITIIIGFVCAGAFLFLLAGSTVPVFTIKELKDHPEPNSLINRNIQLIGIVQQINNTGFFIIDPEDVTNASLSVYINAIYVEKPTGFKFGGTVLVEGKLISITNMWTFKAYMISTKCPSKYQG